MQEAIKLHYLTLLTAELLKQNNVKEPKQNVFINVRVSRVSICKEILQEIGVDSYYEQVLKIAHEKYNIDIFQYDVANAKYQLRKLAKLKNITKEES